MLEMKKKNGMKRKKSRRYRPAVAGLVWLMVLSQAGAAEKKKSKFVPQAILAGTVFQENGFLLRGARVIVYNAEKPKDKKEAVTDLAGEFAVRVPAGKGRYTIEASAPGFVSESKTVEVSGDERLEVTFRLALYHQARSHRARSHRGPGLQAASRLARIHPAQCHLAGWYQSPDASFFGPRIFRTPNSWDSGFERWLQQN